MNSFKKIASPLALAAAVAFAPAAFADEQQPAIDKAGNGKAMASCVIDFTKQAIVDSLNEAANQAAPVDPGQELMDIQQEMLNIMAKCAATLPDVPADQVPALPSMPGPNATDQEMLDFLVAAEAFGDFLTQYIDEAAFENEMMSRFGELMEFMFEKIEEMENAPKPKAPAPAPAP